MAKTFLFTTILIVVCSSVNSERRPFLSYSNNLQKAAPHYWKNDQEELNRNLVKNAGQPWGEMRVGPHPPPLRPNPPAQWPLMMNHAEKELTQNRVNQLKSKLIPNNIINIRALNQPNPKPKIELKWNRHKQQEVVQTENGRGKREVIINPQMKPEMVMQPHLQPAIVQEVDNQYQDKITEKRDKRQILMMINQRPLQLAKKPRTTPNPFIRDTNIADYDLVKPESYKPDVEVVNSLNTDSYQLREPQSLFEYLKSMIFKIGQKNPNELIPMATIKYVNEEKHIRVKRRMSRFRRDRKQMTRKKKIGRKKKTKVRRAPIKLKKWYHKRQKTKKKGDGTYRGGRGRIPRQHKRPRHYKPPRNETSDYDYYDDDGKIKEPSGETQEGSDDAAYVSYGTGEYADTAEAEAAHQQLEKEYQMQLVRQRKKVERRRLANTTVESSEEEFLSINRYVESDESVSNTTNSREDEEDEEEYYDEEDSEEDDSEQEEDIEGSSGSGTDSGGGGKKNNKNVAKKINDKVKEGKKTSSHTKQPPKTANSFKAFDQIRQHNNNKASEFSNYQKPINIHKNANENIDLVTNTLHDARLTAQKLNVISQSAFPGFRNSLQQKQPSNWMSAVKFGIPQNKLFKNLQSMPHKKIPDVNSLTNPILASTGGRNLQNLQSKKVYNTLESTSHDKKLTLTSTVKDKSENDQTFTSKTKDRRKKLTSIGNDGLKLVQSLKRHPLALTSIARHIPDMDIGTVEVTDPKISNSKSDKTDNKITQDTLKLEKEKTVDNRKRETTGCNRETMNDGRKNKQMIFKNTSEGKRLYSQKNKNYDELSSVSNQNLGTSVSSDEIEPAPDDK